MKRIALILSIMVLFSFSMLLAANVDQAAQQKNFNAKLLPSSVRNANADQTNSTMGETVIFQEDFESGTNGWFMDGGYATDGGDSAVTTHPSTWEISDVKANSPTHSLFHPDEVDASRDFVFSPGFIVPAEIGGDPVVSAKVSFMLNIDNPGYGDPNNPGYLGDYFSVWAGLEETTFAAVNDSGNMVYYSGYPEANSFQYLTSPLIDLTAATAPVTLTFDSKMINEIHWDLGRVDILVDGVDGYTTVAVLDSNGVWASSAIDLSAQVGNTVKVRFSFLPDAGTAVKDGGLWVDNIKVTDASGDLFMDDAEAGNAVMAPFGITLAQLFYDYDRVKDAGASWNLWDESALFNGTADLFDLGIQAGDSVWLAVRYQTDADNTQGEDASAGIFFDDFAVTAISGVPTDAGVSDLVVGYPQTAGQPSILAATVSNFGFEAQSIPLWRQIGDGPEMPVPPYLELDAFGDTTRVFDVKYPEADSAAVVALTKLPGDMVPENDGLAQMVHLDPAGVATLNYAKASFSYYWPATNTINLYDPIGSLEGVEKYNIESIDLFFFNPSGADDAVKVTVATWTDDPLTPVDVLFDGEVTVPGTGVAPVRVPVLAADVTNPIAVWINTDNSNGGAGLLSDDGTPFVGNDLYFDTDDQAWYVLPYGLFSFANITYATPPQEITSFMEDFDAPVDLGFWTPNTATNDDGTPIFDVSQEDGALKVVMQQKSFPDGQMYDWAVLNQFFNLTENPLWSLKVKVMPGATYTKDGETSEIDEIPFMGSPFSVDTSGNTRQHSNPTIMVPDDGEWHELMFDWSTPDDDQIKFPNDYTNITRLLLETVAWPGTHTATFYIDDFKVGDAAVPPPPPMPPIVHASHPPAIDGLLDPIWEMTPWVRDYVYPSGATTFNDAALSWRAMWDYDYLYIYVSVVDDSLNADTQIGWHGDSVELWLDGDNSKLPDYDGVNDLGYGWLYSNDPEDPLFMVDQGEWRMGTTGQLSGATKTELGFDLEIAIPMANLGITMPAPGQLIGMDVDYNDNDTPDGQGRNTKVKWFDATDNSWQNPSLMGTIELVERTVYDYTDVWYTDAAPVIDGQPDDFLADLPSFPLNHYMNSADSLHSFDDMALEFKAAWDSSYLYYFINVTDDVFLQEGAYNWTDDGIELWFDGDNSKKSSYDGINDMGLEFQYMTDAALDSFYFFDGGPGYVKFDSTTVLHASTRTADGIYLEFAMPIDSIGVKPQNGWKFGHEFDYNDSDTPGLNRDTKCKTYAEQDNTWNTPSAFGTAMLMGGPGEPMAKQVIGLMIDKTNAAPTIDGEWEPIWDNARNIEIANVVDGAIDNWWDSYGNYRILYDSKNLYMFVQVNDDSIYTVHANDYEKDCIELYFDGDNSKNVMPPDDPWAWPPVAYDENDDQLRFVYNSPPTSSEGRVDLSGVDYAYAETPTGWNLEFSMPLKNQPFKAKAGNIIGFEININDNDGGDREAITKWWGHNDEAWHDPSAFGTAKFTARAINDKDFGRLLPIPFTAYPIKIDAEPDFAWNNVAEVFGNYRFNETDSVSSPMDAATHWKVAWDYDYLYLMVHVTDDVLVQDGEYNWKDDGIEMWWDGDASLLESYTDANDLSFGWAYDPDNILDPMTNWRGDLDTLSLKKFMQAQKLVADGLVLEMAMPWDVLGTDVGDGALVGIEIDYNDDDTGDSRDTKVKSYDPTDGTWGNPSLMGLARLVGSKIESDVEENVEVVTTFELRQNYPNPFNPSTHIEFSLPIDGQVKLVIYDVLGRQVVTLLDQKMDSGKHSISFDASQYASGVYFYSLQTSERNITKKMMLLK